MPASLISVSTALLFPVALVAVLWPLGLTGIWLSFPLTSLLAGAMALAVMKKQRPALNRPDEPLREG